MSSAPTVLPTAFCLLPIVFAFVGEAGNAILFMMQTRLWVSCTLTSVSFGLAPFRPLPQLAPAWLAWEGGTVPKLAAEIYDERAFDRLPILADALEEAGCDAPELLAHLRGPGPHVRGYWAVDLALGKG